MKGYPLLETGCLLSIMAILPPQSSADELKLVNGDQLSGTVIAVDKDKVTFNNSVLGKITILRSKVAAIHLGDERRTVSTTKAGKPTGQTSPTASPDGEENKSVKQDVRLTDGQIIKELRARGLKLRSLDQLKVLLPQVRLPQDTKPEQSGQDVIDKLRTDGLDASALSQAQSQVPLLAIPGVRGYFDRTLGDLISGQMNLRDLRKDALRAREGLVDIQKVLGPNGAALNGYLMIFDGFLRQTKPKPPARSQSPVPKPESPKLR